MSNTDPIKKTGVKSGSREKRITNSVGKFERIYYHDLKDIKEMRKHETTVINKTFWFSLKKKITVNI